jgi:hypothetical protein
MLIDIILSIVQACIVLYMGWCGLYMTLHPIPPDDLKRITWNKRVFVAGAILSAFLVGWQAIRNGTSQRELFSAVTGLDNSLNVTKDSLNIAKDSLYATGRTLSIFKHNNESLLTQIKHQGESQTEIAQRQLDIQYEPSISLVFGNDHFQLYNYGRTNIFFCGWGHGNGDDKEIYPPLVISPGEHYFLQDDSLRARIDAIMRVRKSITDSMRIYFENAMRVKYVGHFLLYLQKDSTAVTLNTQVLPTTTEKWPSFSH